MATAVVNHSPTVDIDTCEPDDGLSVFTDVRPRLFAIAYRMLRSAAEAEDVVQDVWLRWQQTNRSAVQDAPAFLATTTSRLCLNIAHSARSRREVFVGPWLREPVDIQANPERDAMRGAGLKLALMMLLERLSPTERAAYLLREAFDYSYRQIAAILKTEYANTRQLVVRARKNLAEGRRASVAPTEQKRLLDAFIHAAQEGDLAALESLLAKDVDLLCGWWRVPSRDTPPGFWSRSYYDVRCRHVVKVVERSRPLCGAPKLDRLRSRLRCLKALS